MRARGPAAPGRVASSPRDAAASVGGEVQRRASSTYGAAPTDVEGRARGARIRSDGRSVDVLRLIDDHVQLIESSDEATNSVE